MENSAGQSGGAFGAGPRPGGDGRVSSLLPHQFESNAQRLRERNGAGEAERATLGTTILPIYQAHYQRGVAAARALLNDATFAAAWAAGRELTLEQAIAEALVVAEH